MVMLKSFRAEWKRKRTSKKNKSNLNSVNRPIISAPILNSTSIQAIPARPNYAQPYRIPYAVPYPVATEKQNTSVRRRLTVYFKKEAQPVVSITAISTLDSTQPSSRTNPMRPLISTFSSQSTKSTASSSSSRDSTLLRRNSINGKITPRGNGAKMPVRSTSLRRASGDLLSVYTFLGGQETISADPKNRRASRFYMYTQYENPASTRGEMVSKILP